VSAQSQHEEARKCSKRALRILEARPGSEHPHTKIARGVDEEVEAKALRARAEDDATYDARVDRLNTDTRTLEFSDRFRLVQKYKEEGTELFKDGKIPHSIKRYLDALAHALKISSKNASLSPEQEQQTKKVKLDLHLNISLCWTKLDDIDLSLHACNEALKLDEKYSKALYRRAYAYERQSRFDDAKRDITTALAQVPDDKALLVLRSRVDAQIARLKKKEKDMWGKAFKS